MKEIMFFANGNTATFIDGNQIPELQKSWLQLAIGYIQKKGYDPEDFVYTMPNGKQCKLFKTGSGYNWKF